MKKLFKFIVATIMIVAMNNFITKDKGYAEEGQGGQWYLTPPYNCANQPGRNHGKCCVTYNFIIYYYFIACLDDGGSVNPDCCGVALNPVIE